MSTPAALFEAYLSEWIDSFPWDGTPTLREAVSYSLLGGGKRFRPLLSLMVAEAYGRAPFEVLPWAAAVEMVHTYSLIHDDLPCMDNDDFRRGKPTNHKVFGDAMALLAGDTLLTESFGLVARAYVARPVLAAELVSMLAGSAGAQGMIAGQIRDLQISGRPSAEEVRKLHELKTGRMILAPIVGAATILEASGDELKNWTNFGTRLGFAFQLADDILDAEQDQGHARSWISLSGIEETRSLLRQVTNEALADLDRLKLPVESLRQIVIENQERKA